MEMTGMVSVSLEFHFFQFYSPISIRPGTQPEGFVFLVIHGIPGGINGLTCADWM